MNIRPKTLILVFCFMLLFSLSGPVSAEQGGLEVESIYLTVSEHYQLYEPKPSTEDTISIRPGGYVLLYPRAVYANGEDRLISDVVWDISDPQVAGIDKDFVLTGIKEGSAVVTANYEGHTASVKITVNPFILVSVLNHTDASIEDGTIIMKKNSGLGLALNAIHAGGVKENVSRVAKWESTNPDVAYAIATGNPLKGEVTLISVNEGETEITASLNGIKSKYRVKVVSTEGKPIENTHDQINVKIDGAVQTYDQPPVITGERTLVPMRGIFEALGANVSWDQETQTVTATRGDTVIRLTIGSPTAYKNGVAIVLEQPPRLIKNRSMVPVRFVGEALGAKVDWDGSTRTVIITGGGNVIRIGLIAPLTGEIKDFGNSVKNAFTLALEEKQHRAGSHKIEAIIADDRNDATEAVNMAAKLIFQDKVSAIMGSLTSKTTIPLSRFATDNKVVVITGTATSEKVTMEMGKRKEFVFRAAFIDPLQGTMGARFALENLRKKTAAVLYDQGNSYAEGLAGNFKETFERGGGRVLLYEAYSNMDVDFTPVLTRIARQKPDILYLPDYYMKSGLIGKQARQQGIQAVFLGGDGWDTPDIDWQTMDGGYFTTHWSPDDPRPEVREWVNKYKAKYGATPDPIATLAYDAANILLRAIELADSSDPVKIREALQNIKDFQAVTGKISFDQDGNPVKPVTVLQIKDGQQVYAATINP